MKNTDNGIIGWRRSFYSFKYGMFLSIVLTILPFGLFGSNLDLQVMAGAVFQVIYLPLEFLVIGAGMIKAIVSVAICTFILIFAFVGTYIKKLLRENDTKARAIIGLREIIRLLEDKSEEKQNDL